MVEHLPSIESGTYRFPTVVRQQLAAEMVDVSTEVGASLAAAVVASTRTALGTTPLTSSRIDPLAMYAEPGTTLVMPTPLVPDTHQATHSSVLAFPERFAGYEYWMGFTPYPGGENTAENPCIAASHDGVTWVVPAGLTNPIDTAVGVTVYNSDTELVLGPDGKLWLMWRTVDVPNSQEILYLSTSADGVVWSAKVAVYVQPFSVRRLLSPTLVFEEGAWTMWAVDLVPEPNQLVRLRSAGPTLTGTSDWGVPTVCTTGALAAGKDPWHIQVRKVGGQYVGLMVDEVIGSGGSQKSSLILMTSPDGLAWSNRGTSVIPTRIPNVYNRLYRSSFVPMFVGGEMRLRTWYAGILDTTSPPTWRLFLTDIRSTAFGNEPYSLVPGDPVPSWLPKTRSIVRLQATAGEVRRNRAICPGPTAGVFTGWSSGYAGAGGTAGPNVADTGGPAEGAPGEYHVTWTVAPTVSTVYITYGRSAVSDIAVTPGETLTLSAWVKPSWVAASTGIRALFYTSAGALIGSEVLGEIFPHAAGTWERRDLTTIVPATAARVALRLYSQNGTIAIGDTLRGSSILAEGGGLIRDYFDGGHTPINDVALTPSWAGTVNGSESILTATSSYRQFWDGVKTWNV